MYDEYDPISLFEYNSCFRVNTQTFLEPTLKIGLSKMYPYFKLLIFGKSIFDIYKSIFDEIFDPPRVFLCAEHESAVIFCPRPREYDQKIAYNEVPHTR